MGYKTYTCPIAKRCGGCEWLAVPYELQLKRKQASMEVLFSEICEADAATVDQIHGMAVPMEYRYKAATPFAPDKQNGTSRNKTRMRCGFYERGSHRIVYCKQCLVEAAGLREILTGVASISDSLRIPAYNEDTSQGVLRHAVVRAGYASGEILLTLVTNGPSLPRTQELVQRLRTRFPRITTIVQNTNDRRTNAILGTRSKVLFGPGVIHDKLLECTFEISSTSFYQTNPAQTEVLYLLAIEGVLGEPNDNRSLSLLDAYCGTGTIGLCAARQAADAGTNVSVTGVEQVSGAVGCARRNARANGLRDSAVFVCNDATKWMASQKRGRFEAAILDPPRAGSTPEFLHGLARLAPHRIAYVSCNPSTQVRDLAILRQQGYRVQRITPVDMFPHTRHVETVCLLTHR